MRAIQEGCSSVWITIDYIECSKCKKKPYDTRFRGCPEPPKRIRSKMTLKKRWNVLERDNHKCVACGSNDRLEVDHIKPVSKGGTSDECNLQVLCFKCNRGKSND